MSTLLLRLAAPLQAWGTDSKFETRRTNQEPSKSGVIGMLAAALGLPRDADLSALAALRFGVRVDRAGDLLHDFHTVKAIKRNSTEEITYITHRDYLADAIFVAGFESTDRKFLEKLENALRHPCYPLFLGRRSCPPTLPLLLGICDKDLETALREAENQNTKSRWQTYRYIRLDCKPGDFEGAVLQDVPISFRPYKREFGYRRVKEIWLQDASVSEDVTVEEHDAMAEL